MLLLFSTFEEVRRLYSGFFGIPYSTPEISLMAIPHETQKRHSCEELTSPARFLKKGSCLSLKNKCCKETGEDLCILHKSIKKNVIKQLYHMLIILNPICIHSKILDVDMLRPVPPLEAPTSPLR